MDWLTDKRLAVLTVVTFVIGATLLMVAVFNVGRALQEVEFQPEETKQEQTITGNN